MPSQIFNIDTTAREHSPLLGLEYESRWRGVPVGQIPSSTQMRIFNIFRIVSYIPRVSWISGAAMCTLGILYMLTRGDERNKTAVVTKLFLRGAATIAFGPYLVIADLAKIYLQEKTLNAPR